MKKMEPWMFSELGWLIINLGHFNHIRWWERRAWSMENAT